MRFIVFLLSLITLTLSLTPNPSTIVDQKDVIRIKNSVQLLSPLSSNSLANIYYSIQSQSLLTSQPISDSNNNICNHLKSKIDQQLENIYFVSSTAKLITNCQVFYSHL
jgi:hypothetical protein